MVQVFAKRFWGFDPKHWPIISFGLEGNRDALIRESQPGDLIAFVGTQGDETAIEDQGRLLGLAEIGRRPVDTLDVLSPDALTPDTYGTNGSFKWPKSLPMLRAWRFVDRPKLVDVLKSQLTYQATVQAVLLDQDDQAAVLALRTEEVELPDIAIIKSHRAVNQALTPGISRGPRPTTWSGEVSRDASAAASTYALRFGKRNVWKIGHAQDVASRLAEINKHIPSEVIEEQWILVWTQSWPDQTAAYQMEQRVLERLKSFRSAGERVICSDRDLQIAWTAAVLNA